MLWIAHLMSHPGTIFPYPGKPLKKIVVTICYDPKNRQRYFCSINFLIDPILILTILTFKYYNNGNKTKKKL